MIEGWICLHRQILDSVVFAHPVALKLWVWCLCKASHSKKSVPFRYGESVTTVKLDKGQFIFGRHKAEEELFIDGSTIYKLMKKFSDEWSMIKIESNNRYSIVTILNFNKFQENLIKEKRKSNRRVAAEEQQSSSRVTAKEQQSNTYNNDNNDNNIVLRANKFHEGLLPYVATYGQDLVEEFFQYWTEPNKTGKRMRYESQDFFDVPRRLVTWNRKSKQAFQKAKKQTGLIV